MIEIFKGILRACAFCKTPTGNTFVIDNAEEKTVELLVKELPGEVKVEKNEEVCVMKFAGQTVIFKY